MNKKARPSTFTEASSSISQEEASVVLDKGGGATVCEAGEQFDVGQCRNLGKPIMVEWEGKHRPFIDGLGLCSPTR